MSKRKKGNKIQTERRSRYSRAARAVKRIIDEQGANLDLEVATQLGLFMVALRIGRF